ncbi:peroxisome proliferator-activated receptor gamma coactivator-related protein 1 isoform X2 [Gouania willdenowi]|uniref:peroxisome proliferator-activated receptor gamma coactivator-related protein 1 isoform X2 n=1 Tax=Gouania willdenowi TaxID=441366 RepID=UPI00105441D7|nr:peroxisome proliferator-activated receptor gamma coactivator-related protein 1 isoform X2 [Gouania willdenowi]
MAAQWGAGEATLTACNMDFFTMDTLEGNTRESTEDTLEALQNCLDPSILSFFEDTPAIELRRLLCLSRSPPEKQAISRTKPLSSGKSLPKTQVNALQRSDGEEEEEGHLSLSPTGCDSFPDTEPLDWDGLALPLPISFEQEGDGGLSVSLGDLVRHMHSYCMTIHVENEEGEQVLPEGGIVLEVVDKGENEEPILAISDFDVSLVPHMEKDSPNDDCDTSDHIIVDDDDELLNKAPAKTNGTVTQSQCQDLKDEMNKQKEEIRSKSPSRRKKKKKKKKKKCKIEPQSEIVEKRVLRSARKMAQKPYERTDNMLLKIKNKVTKTKEVLPSSVKPKKDTHCLFQTPVEMTTTQLPAIKKPVATVQLTQEAVQSTNILPSEVCSQKVQTKAPTVSTVFAATPISKYQPGDMDLVSTHETPVGDVPLPTAAPVITESKPKSLSLAEYRRLRQQKKPAPLEKQATSSTKWPSLPELPKELPQIPCLPNPMPRDPRRISPQAAKEVDEVKPAWQPRGPGAPPTPEALLAPPAYMVASSSRVSAVTQSKKSLTSVPEQTPETRSTAVKNSDAPLNTNAQQLAPSVGCLKSTSKISSSADETHSLRLVQEKVKDKVSKPASSECTKSRMVSSVCSPKNITDVPLMVPKVTAVNLTHTNVTTDSKSFQPSNSVTPMLTSTAADLVNSQKTEEKTTKEPATVVGPQKVKSPTQVLIESFTSEIGIEAADLTSLLEQFEETQAKVEQCVSEVSGRAAAVGNSSVELVPEKTVVERLRAADLCSTPALTPPATPPQQLWKPVPLGKSKAIGTSKCNTSKVIPIEARPLPSSWPCSKPAAAAPVDPSLACRDHDYCLPNKSAELYQRWNVKRNSSITIKPIMQQTETNTRTHAAGPVSSVQPSTNPVVSATTKVVPFMEPLQPRINEEEKILLDTPDASPIHKEIESTKYSMKIHSGRTYRQRDSSQSRSPSPNRGRSRKRPHHSPSTASSCSDSDWCSSRSRSRSISPRKKRYRSRHSESRSSSSSRSSSWSSHSMSPSPPRRRKYSYSSSRSGSWSRSRSPSGSPQRSAQWNRSRGLYSPTYRPCYSQSKKPSMEEAKRRKEKAIEERRIVYVGRIRGTMTQKELGERFSFFGEIEECTLHFRNHGDNYGFVTYYNTNDAFNAIENGSKLRNPDELPFDLCFGGRRQFCQTSYADLDSNREYDPFSAKPKINSLDFDTLLKQAQQNLKR